ncbi:hypothetical protein L0F63_005442 [Massospora cicadina]|nr:hypothetical protein L0F63_005442 [Massospora cicadina]
MLSQDHTADPDHERPSEFMATAETNSALSPQLRTQSQIESTLMPIELETTGSSSIQTETSSIIKLRSGRKRKGDVIDRDALRRDRVIRNRMAAQRSREKKRNEYASLEKGNEELCEINSRLEERVQSLENANLLLFHRLSEMSTQMLNLQSQLQSQVQTNQAFSLLFNGFGEPAVLTVGVRSRSLSQQRKPLIVFQDRLFQLMLVAGLAQLIVLTLWTARQFLTIFSPPGTTPKFFLLCRLNKRTDSHDFLPPIASRYSLFGSCLFILLFSDSYPKLTLLLKGMYSKWFPPSSD